MMLIVSKDAGLRSVLKIASQEMLIVLRLLNQLGA